MAKKKGKGNNSKYIGVVKGVITALVFAILAILVYAVVLKTFSMGDGTIVYFNQIIKIAGIIISAYYSVIDQGKAYYGVLGGLMYILVTFGLFSLVNGAFGSSSTLISDIIMGAVIGWIFGIIVTRLKGIGDKRA